MSKILEATCSAGVVSSEGRPIEEAQILSEGVAQSSGVMLLEGERQYYIAKTSGDLKDVITSVCGLVDHIITVLTAHDGALGGTQAATILALTTAKTTLLSKKDALK